MSDPDPTGAPVRADTGDIIASFMGADLTARLNISEGAHPAVLTLNSERSRFQIRLLLGEADITGLRDMLTRGLDTAAARRTTDPALSRDLDAWTNPTAPYDRAAKGEPTGDGEG